MNEHTGPYVDSNPRHRKTRNKRNQRKKQSPERKENKGTKTKEETEKYILEMELCSDFSFIIL